MKSAEIEPLPGLEWNAHAALHDALNRCKMDRPVVVLWIEDDGRICHASSAKKQEVLWMIEKSRTRLME